MPTLRLIYTPIGLPNVIDAEQVGSLQTVLFVKPDGSKGYATKILFNVVSENGVGTRSCLVEGDAVNVAKALGVPYTGTEKPLPAPDQLSPALTQPTQG